MTAASQMNRIVQIISESSRLGEGSETPIAELAKRFGVTAAQIHEDVRVLTLLGEEASAEWLLSLEVWQEQDRVRVASRGPWRRPLRLTPDELVALKIALAADPDAALLLAKLSALGQGPETAAIDVPGMEEAILAQVRRAVGTHHRLEILYAGEGQRAARARTVQPHQLFSYGGFWYCVAWCECAGAWRHFRLDRMVEARLADGSFVPRDDITLVSQAEGVFHADADIVEKVRVRFTPLVARWVKERYPEHEPAKGGAVDVVFRAGSPHWLARHVLQYGAEAEVIEPKAYREAVRGRVGKGR